MTTQSTTKPAAESRAAAAAAGQALPSARTAAPRRARRLWARSRDADAQERRGYGVWLFVGLVFGVPES